MQYWFGFVVNQFVLKTSVQHAEFYNQHTYLQKYVLIAENQATTPTVAALQKQVMIVIDLGAAQQTQENRRKQKTVTQL